MAEELPGGCRGGDQPPGDDLGRRTAATGSLLPQGAASTGDAPPIVVVAKSAQLRFRLRRKLRPLPCSSSPHRAGRGGGPFRSCQKRNGPCTVQREKCVARCGAVALRADGGRRIGASADFGPPSGTLGPSAIFPTAVPWREYQPCRGGYRMELLLFSLPLAVPRGNWRSGPIKASAPTEIPSALRILWGPTCVSALARVTKATSPVGADALVHPPAQAATTAQAVRSDCAAVGDAACSLRASGTRGRRSQWNTGDGNTGSAAARDRKRGAVQMRPCPPIQDALRRGNPPLSLHRTPPRPSGDPRKHAGTLSRRPPYSNFARMCKVAAKAPFSLIPGAARSLFDADKKRMGAHLHGRQHG